MSKLGGLAGKMPYTAVIAMIGALTIMGVPPTSGFMAEWVMFNGVLQTAANDGDWFRTAMFGFGIMGTILTSAYILWMIKRIFFGKIPEEMAHVKEASPYVTATMAAFAALSLIIGVYPDLFLEPVSGYIQGVFADNPGVLPIPEGSGLIQPAEGSSIELEEGLSMTEEAGGEH
jgi:NADH-quinone oxidoreductase subunit M